MIVLCPFTCADGDTLLTRTGSVQPQAAVGANARISRSSLRTISGKLGYSGLLLVLSTLLCAGGCTGTVCRCADQQLITKEKKESDSTPRVRIVLPASG